MKSPIIFGAILLAGFAVDASAGGCSEAGYTNRLDQTQIPDALSGKRIFATGSEEWKEDHCANGNLYKVGAGTAVDPRAYRGKWAIIGTDNDAQVKYTYTVGGTSEFIWSLWSNSSGALCWEGAGAVIATTALPPSSFGSLSCTP
jgi:hypothetical protein